MNKNWIVNKIVRPSRRVALLQQLTEGVQEWLDGFEPPRNGGHRIARLVADNCLMAVENYPLPDRYLPHDYIDLVLDVRCVPATPPNGFYAIEKNNITTINHISRWLGGHLYSSERGINDTHTFKGGVWVCLHYADNKWRFNAKYPERGDNPAKFLATVYARLV